MSLEILKKSLKSAERQVSKKLKNKPKGAIHSTVFRYSLKNFVNIFSNLS